MVVNVTSFLGLPSSSLSESPSSSAQASWKLISGSGGGVKVLGSWSADLVMVGWLVVESAGFTTGST